MKFNQVMLALTTLLTVTLAEAKVKVLFHPYDPTLETIAARMGEAQSEINIVMYNMDTTDASPIVQKLKTTEMQNRILNGELKIRVLFEGYGTTEENEAKMQQLEDLGLDAKFLGTVKKVHHKFAVIDPGTEASQLITGSANWSLSSARNYSENIMFIDHEPQLTAQFYQEFALLWGHAQEFGETKWNDLEVQPEDIEIDDSQAHVFLNSAVHYGNEKNFYLTKKLVAAIDQAESEILIATTRFKLAPVFAAIQRAAERGVQIKIALSMDEYVDLFARAKPTMKDKVDACDNVFNPKCSSGVNFAPLLAFGDFAGQENIQLRIKFFSLKKEDYLQKQLHSKYIIIDRKTVLTGSFNWSYSSEGSHVENIVVLTAADKPAIAQFNNDFERLWSLNRDNYTDKLAEVKKIKTTEVKCGFDPMTLSMNEIDKLLFPTKGVYAYKLCK